jgi:Protein of unknown function (DUF559)
MPAVLQIGLLVEWGHARAKRPARQAKLAQGHNANYWIRKIERNVARDREWSRELRAAGWLVLRVWESEVHSNVGEVVRRIESVLRQGALHELGPVGQAGRCDGKREADEQLRAGQRVRISETERCRYSGV